MRSTLWIGSVACRGHTHCFFCRTDAAWRESALVSAGFVESGDFDCPYGITKESAEKIQAEAIAKIPPYNPEVAEKRKRELEEQGRAAWLWLHTAAAEGTLTEERITKEFEPMIPRHGCGCLNEWRADNAKMTFRPKDQIQWAIERHNLVNAKLGKPRWDGGLA